MELTLEQIKSVAIGALNIFEDAEGIHFRRFSDNQLRIFSEMNEQYRHRSHCTAGCQLSFHTNSQNILLAAAAGAKYEILIDGLPTYFFALETPRRIPVSLPAGDKHIVISLPNYTEGILDEITLDEGSYVHPEIPSRKFLFLGDSITQGAQSSRDSGCYAYRVTRFFNAQLLNQAVGGSRMHPETLEDNGYSPDAIFIAYGTNDYTRFYSTENLERNACAYFDRVRELYPDTPVYYISPLWRADGNMVKKTGTLDDCRKALIAQCQAHGFTHIDGYSLVPHSPDYFNDGYLHPNDLGFSIYAENLIKFLLNEQSSR